MVKREWRNEADKISNKDLRKDLVFKKIHDKIDNIHNEFHNMSNTR